MKYIVTARLTQIIARKITINLKESLFNMSKLYKISDFFAYSNCDFFVVEYCQMVIFSFCLFFCFLKLSPYLIRFVERMMGQ